MSKPGWGSFEAYMADLLGLDRTISSGNKHFDPGDAVTRGRNAPFPLFADAKFTAAASFSLKLRELRQYQERAAELGKRFVMPIRFWLKGDVRPEDFLLIGLHDFAELLQLCTGQGTESVPTQPLLTEEERQLLIEASELIHPGPTRMRLLQLIDRLDTTEVA